MVKSANKSGDGSGSVGSVAPFLRKCYEMVDDGATDSIISWSETNDCFVIWDMTQFSVLLLPKYFKHSNFSSFMRQLNIYGFRKIDPDRWVFANEGFIRGQKHLLENIYRRKHPHGSDQRKTLQQKDTPDGPCEKIENVLWREVENLKTDKNALKQELVKLRQHQETSENKLLLLRDQLCGMEKNQQQMLSFLVMAMQSPGFLLQLLQPKENSWRMAEAGKVLEQGADDCELVVSDGAIVRYQPPMDETPKPILTPNSGSEKEPEHDSHLDGTKDFFVNPDFMKMLMDEKSCSLENHSPFILPDITDDGAWERLLLASPFLENIEGAMEDGKEPVDSGKAEHHHSLHELIGQDEDPESTASELDESHDFDSLMEEMEKSQNFAMESTIFGSDTGNSRNLELITEQMGLLVSDPNDKHRTQRGK